MNCGCSVTDGVITMCPMHEAGPKLWKVAERLLQAHGEAHAEAAKDPDWERKFDEAVEGNEYTLSDGVAVAISDIDEILNGPIYYKLSDDAVDEARTKTTNLS